MRPDNVWFVLAFMAVISGCTCATFGITSKVRRLLPVVLVVALMMLVVLVVLVVVLLLLLVLPLTLARHSASLLRNSTIEHRL